ncbi:MAG: PAS domain S-box protein [Candidatus Contendobacter sp.]|nr:PAS domain S-box protein [Candidatus Contendobacter sp.]
MDDDLIARLQAENARLRADNQRLEALLRQRAGADEVISRKSTTQQRVDLRILLDEAVDFISTADLNGRVGYLNRAGRRLVGIDETADIGQFQIADMHPPWAADLILSEAVPTALQGGVWRGETALTTRDGREIPVSQVVLAHRTRQGQVKFLFTIIRDITEQKRVREELAREARVNAALAEISRALLARTSVDDMADLVLEHAKRLTDSAHGFVGYIDPMTGYLVSSTLGRDVWDLCQVQDKTVVFKEFKGLWGWVLNHRQSLLTNAPADDPRSSGTPPGHIPIQRFISAPAMAEGVLVGQVVLANSDRDYGEQDLALIERLADLYAMAIQRKRMEEHLRESQEQFNAFMDHLPAVAFIKDDQCRHVYLNKYLRECFDAADWLGKTISEKLPPVTAREMMASDRQALAGSVLELEQTLMVANGETRVFQTIKFPMRTHAAPSLIGGVAIDITDQKRARDALQESEAKYRRLYESLRDAFVSTDMSGRLQEFNTAYQRMLGYSEEELFRLTYQDLTPKKWHAFETEIIEQQVLPWGYSEVYEKEYRRKDGTIFPIELRTILVRDATGQPAGMWAIVRDISRRKRVEESLRASEAKFRRLIEASPVAMGVADAQGHIEYLNPRFIEQFGYRREDIPSIKEWFLRAYPDPIYRQGILERWNAGMENARRNGTDIALTDMDIVHRDGSVRVVNVVGTLIGDKILAIFNDITDRKRIESALRDSRDLMSVALKAAKAGAWQWNLRTQEIVWSDENYLLLDLEPQSVRPSYALWQRYVHPDDRARIDAQVKQSLRDRRDLNIEYRIVISTGIRWINSIGMFQLDEHGEPIGLHGIQLDITERKQAEDALRESEDRFAAFMDHLPALTFIKDQDSRYLFANQYFRQHIDDGWLNKATSEVYPTEVAAPIIADDRRALATGFQRQERLIPLANGETRIFETVKFPLPRAGKPMLLGGFAIDITERKQAEAELRRHREHLEEMVAERTSELALANQKLRLEIAERERTEQSLRQSEARLHLALEVANAGAWEWNVKDDAIAWSPEVFPLFGLPCVEQPGFETRVERLHPDDRDRVLEWVQKNLARRSDLSAQEYRIVRMSGEIRWISDTARIFYDSAGRPERMVGINIDITQRKQAEEELRESEARLRLALQAADAGVWEWDLRSDRNVASKRALEIFGRGPDFLPFSLEKLLRSIHPDDRAWTQSKAWEAVESGGDLNLEFRIVRADGEIRWVQDFGTLIHDEAGHPLRMIGTMIDITARKQIEIELKNYRDHLERLVGERTAALEATNVRLQQEIAERQRAEQVLQLTQFMVDQSAEEIYLVRPDSGFDYVNEAACRALGHSRNELLGLRVPDISPSDLAQNWPITWRILKEAGHTTFEALHKRKNGELYPVEITATHLRFGDTEYNCAFVRDIRERKATEEKIKSSLQEKEVLLKEIHHRVKNNLQIITSLLDLQAEVIGDRATREKFRESRNRVRSMALIHERLYRAADLASIDFAEYVRKLTDSLFSSYASANRSIALQTDIEPLSISVEHAVPCGLIINELITNALKYAFPPGRAGIIGVELKMSGEKRVMLRVWDNGVGLPPAVDPQHSETLGLTIVATLIRQLRGNLTLQRVGGTGFTISFVVPPVKTTQSVLEKK